MFCSIQLIGQIQVSDTIDISYLYNVSIIFDEPITSEPLFGSSVAINFSQPDRNTITIKADGQWMAEHRVSRISNTNMTIRTTSKLYNFIISYDKQPKRTIITSNEFQPVHTYDNVITEIEDIPVEQDKEASLSSILVPLSLEPQELVGVGVNASKFKLLLTVPNIWVDDEYIYIKYIITNYSAVPYDIDYYRYVTTYKKFDFNQSTDPIEDLQAVASLKDSHNSITQGIDFINVIAFNKFTLNKKEFLNIQVGEKNGSRLISAAISWKHILEAQPIPARIRD